MNRFLPFVGLGLLTVMLIAAPATGRTTGWYSVASLVLAAVGALVLALGIAARYRNRGGAR